MTDVFNLRNAGGYRYIPSILPTCLEHATPCAQRLWFYFLRKATYKPSKNIQKGQLLTSREDIKAGTFWTEKNSKKTFSTQEIKTALIYLTKHKLIETIGLNGGHKGLLVTVLFYEQLQSFNMYNREIQPGSCNNINNKNNGLYNTKDPVQPGDVKVQPGDVTHNDESKQQLTGNKKPGSTGYEYKEQHQFIDSKYIYNNNKSTVPRENVPRQESDENVQQMTDEERDEILKEHEDWKLSLDDQIGVDDDTPF